MPGPRQERAAGQELVELFRHVAHGRALLWLLGQHGVDQRAQRRRRGRGFAEQRRRHSGHVTDQLVLIAGAAKGPLAA